MSLLAGDPGPCFYKRGIIVLKLWDLLNGRKAHIGHFYWAVVIPSSVIIWPEGIPVSAGKVIAVVGVALTAFGYGHKAMKAVPPKPGTPRIEVK